MSKKSRKSHLTTVLGGTAITCAKQNYNRICNRGGWEQTIFLVTCLHNGVSSWLTTPTSLVHCHGSSFKSTEATYRFPSQYQSVCTCRGFGVSHEQLNKITAYIDALNVYPSSSDIVVEVLRTLQDGKMKLQDNGIIPYNTFGLANDNPVGRPQSTLLIAGDTRSNVQPGLIALHLLFVREHNR
ncbi:peroxinectin A-like [Corticium candelabrum]|uniref:peroxinectin A-like n=1 Tax=Corticium candelabrum TaxID=121492 RepID=UPI002E25A878|nr:peroxinectin A-like [Corticium candelabrum]